MLFPQGGIKERFGKGALELCVWEVDKTFEWAYHPAKWHSKPIEEQRKLKDAAIRISDYWKSKGYRDRNDMEESEIDFPTFV